RGGGRASRLRGADAHARVPCGQHPPRPAALVRHARPLRPLEQRRPRRRRAGAGGLFRARAAGPGFRRGERRPALSLLSPEHPGEGAPPPASAASTQEGPPDLGGPSAHCLPNPLQRVTLIFALRRWSPTVSRTKYVPGGVRAPLPLLPSQITELGPALTAPSSRVFTRSPATL